MSIHMKEWGMMRAPVDSVHLPTQGLRNWDAVAGRFGEGVASVLRGSAELAEGQRRVRDAGELADFTERLRTIGEETRAEMADRDVQDWDFAWRSASEPRLAEALAGLPPSARQAGLELAEAFSNRASMEAYRDHSVQSLEKAREQWRRRVEQAVEQGDGEQAKMWLQQGKGIFVPENQAPATEKEVGSRACFSRWQRDVAQDALGSLERWASATPEKLPAGEPERAGLSELMGRTRRTAQQALVQQVSQELEQGREVPADLWARARRAGLISQRQHERVSAPAARVPAAETCRWLRRVDEVEDDADARLALQLDISTSPLPVARRKELLQRLEAGGKVARPDRLAMSRHLWNLYDRGAFGCPGDAIACRRMADLQRHGLQLLATDGVDAAAHWLDSQHRCDNRWVCFSDSRKNA